MSGGSAEADLRQIEQTPLNQEFAEMGLDPQYFEALERDFQQVLEEMLGDKSLERFRAEYEKIHRALKTSYDSEKRLVKRCRELHDLMLQNAARVKSAIALTKKDSQTISTLQKEVEKVWKMVDLAKEKEDKARQIIHELRSEITNLNKIVEQGSGLSIGQDSTVHNLMRQKEDLAKQNNEKDEKIKELDEKNNNLLSELASKESEVAKKMTEITSLNEEKKNIQDKNLAHERTLKIKEEEDKKNKSEISGMQNKIKEKEAEIKQLNEEIQNSKDREEDMNKTIEDLKSEMKQKLNDIQTLEQEQKSLQTTNMRHDEKLRKLENEVFQYSGKLKEVEKENNKLTKENNSLIRSNERLDAKWNDAETQKNLAIASMNALTREIEALRKTSETEKKEISNLVRDRDTISKNLGVTQEKNKKIKEDIDAQERAQKGLIHKISDLKEQIEKLTSSVYTLEKDRDKYGHEASKANANLIQMVEEVKLKKNLISELKKENVEFEGKLKQQQNLYEAVRSDRNLYSKNLIEAQDEVAELKRKFKIASHQITQLKDEIEAKDKAMTQEQMQLNTVKKELEKKERECDLENNLRKAAENASALLEKNVEKLKSIINEAQIERDRLNSDFKRVINERDILGTQLIRRNDELALLYEKIKILQSTLSKGEKQYAERLEDIRLLQLRIAELKSQLKIVQSNAAQIPDLRKEVFNLQQQLLNERLQVKALSEDLQNPINYHRWRKLEGTDPDTWEMLQKIQTLQKRLIKKTEEVVEKDVIIQEKEKLYMELKNLLARQPGPEVAEQLSIYQQNLKEKTRQMKAMASELNMYQAQVNEYKYEIERLTRELQDMKRRYYEQKRREKMHKEAQQKLEGSQIKQTAAPVQRFTGGGFNLAV